MPCGLFFIRVSRYKHPLRTALGTAHCPIVGLTPGIWLFLDLSKNRSRDWCSMANCGNAAKVRRFRQRKAAH
ncbi:CGNR zinc finger domain-containing protein [Saccharospirillum salsuginis]|uniref:CGNR zinc finger domain-containing protein n=1 Tax=Saccharospirillum salsuginis TaxID=418750 RepID=UPI00167B36DF